MNTPNLSLRAKRGNLRIPGCWIIRDRFVGYSLLAKTIESINNDKNINAKK